MLDTSWEKSGKWYKNIVGDEGHYYHQNVILPNLKRLFKFNSKDSLLDLGCGQGILERNISEDVDYVGIDLSRGLIDEAFNKRRVEKHNFLVADVSKDLPLSKTDFSHASIILALQNIKKPFGVVKNANKHLKIGGKFIIVLNHPAFRIPKHSDWEVDRSKNIQYRKIDGYMTPLEIPIFTNPGKREKSDTTWSFHYPMSAYTEMLSDNSFVIETIEEWVSNKSSYGSTGNMENKARKEFPMFLTIVARKES